MATSSLGPCIGSVYKGDMAHLKPGSSTLLTGSDSGAAAADSAGAGMPAGMCTLSSRASWPARWEDSAPAGSHGPLTCCGHMAQSLVISLQSDS